MCKYSTWHVEHLGPNGQNDLKGTLETGHADCTSDWLHVIEGQQMCKHCLNIHTQEPTRCQLNFMPSQTMEIYA